MIGTKSTLKSTISSLTPHHFYYKDPLTPKSTRRILLTSSQSTEPSPIVKFVDYLPHLGSRFLPFPSLPFTHTPLQTKRNHAGCLSRRTRSTHWSIRVPRCSYVLLLSHRVILHAASTHSQLPLSCRHCSTAYRQRIHSPRNCQID